MRPTCALFREASTSRTLSSKFKFGGVQNGCKQAVRYLNSSTSVAFVLKHVLFSFLQPKERRKGKKEIHKNNQELLSFYLKFAVIGTVSACCYVL